MSQQVVGHGSMEDLEAVAEIIARMNSRPETRCLHSADEIEGARHDLQKIYATPEGLVVVVSDDSGITGVIVCDIDPDTGRGWIWGPFAEDGSWPDAPTLLLERLLELLPDTVTRLDTFSDIDNLRAQDLYLGNGFGERRVIHIYVADAPAGSYPTTGGNGISEFDAAYTEELSALHASAFPGTYINGEEMVAATGDRNRIFIATEGARLTGYIYVEIKEVPVEGFVHFLAVRSDARGQGIGRRLLQKALDWCFNQMEMPQVGLCVSDGLTDARSLYESVGFTLQHSGITLRRSIP